MTNTSDSNAVNVDIGGLCFLAGLEHASSSFRNAKIAVVAKDIARLLDFRDKAPREVWPLLSLAFNELRAGAFPSTRFVHQVDYFIQCLLDEFTHADGSHGFGAKAQAAAAGILLALQDHLFQRGMPVNEADWPLNEWIVHLPMLDQTYLSEWTWISNELPGPLRLRVDADRLEIVSNEKVLALRTRDMPEATFAFVDTTPPPVALRDELQTHTLPHDVAASRFGHIFSWGCSMWPAAGQAISDATFFVRGTDCVDQNRWQSGSAPHEPGSIYLTLRDADFLHGFEGLLHETMHQRIYVLERLYPLTRHSRRLYRHKWRTDDRPIRGVLLAAHAFVGVARYYSVCLERSPSKSKDALRGELQATLDGVTDAVRTLRTSDALTEAGDLVVDLIDGCGDLARAHVA